jgi:hypothetical protein
MRIRVLGLTAVVLAGGLVAAGLSASGRAGTAAPVSSLAQPRTALQGAFDSGKTITPGDGTIVFPDPSKPTENAPSDPFFDAPTPNLNRIANALRVREKSVTGVVSVPAGLNLGTPMEISVLFGTTRVTQNYANGAGNRLAADFPALDGQKRRENVVITLRESTGNGYQTYSISYSIDIEPLYDVSFSALTFDLLNDCDFVGASEPIIRWVNSDGQDISKAVSMHGGDSVRLPAFVRIYRETGTSADLRLPGINWIEDDAVDTGFYKLPAPEGPLVPGTTRTVTINSTARNDDYCSAQLRYDVTYQLRTYPDL